MADVSATARRRVAVFDGVRGVAIVLVVLSHGWTLWPAQDLVAREGLRQLFTSGDAAVSVFFVVGSFLATGGLLRLARAGRLRPPVAVVRRWIRLSAQTYALLLTVLVVEVLYPGGTFPDRNTGASVLNASTYTWNWFLHSHPADARPDLGHLWYLSVDFQVFLVVLVATWALRRRTVALAATLAVMLLLCLWWRSHLLDSDPYGVALRTWARADAPLTGALAAVALTWLRRLSPWSAPLAVAGAVALLPAFWFSADFRTYFGWGGLAVDLASAALLIGCTLGNPPMILRRTLGSAPLAFAGRHSLGVYLWHYPVFWFLALHASDWHWPTKAGLAIAVTLVVSLISHRYIEVPAQRLLDAPWWGDLGARRTRGRAHQVDGDTEPAVSRDDGAGRSW
jgi:peptidoglycan/LPS O-acetylase OafA/YrhL